MSLYAYHQRILIVDASSAASRIVELPNQMLSDVIGGTGLATLLALATDQATAEPGSPESAVIFSFSPLVGSPLTTSAKFAVVCRSPLTGLLNDSLASSRFAISGKQTGFDALIITGKADQPSVLLIEEGTAVVQPAADAWGLPCSGAEANLRSRFGKDYAFAVIGPAGENAVRYASVSHDGRHAGRGGTGAVLGMKNIKAIGVRGRSRVEWADPQGLLEASRELATQSRGAATAKYRELGTLSNLLTFNRLNTLPTRNFQDSSFPEAERLSVESMQADSNSIRSSCAACTIGCEHIYPRSSSDSTGVRLEYESVFALGPLCGISDPKVVAEATHLCNELGLDTISMGGTIALAMECSDRAWMPGNSIRFGEGDALLDAIRQTAARTGIGHHLAEGSRRFADHIGHEAPGLAMHVKGLELPGYDLRKLKSLAVGLAVCARGADHNRSGAYEADFSALDSTQAHRTHSVARDACDTEDRSAIMDSMILCKFVRGCLTDFWNDCSRFLTLTTASNRTGEELRETARRIIDLKKLFNQKAGWRQEDDQLPARFFSDAPQNPGTLSRDEFQAHINAYYERRHWETSGRLTDSRHQELTELVNQTRRALAWES